MLKDSRLQNHVTLVEVGPRDGLQNEAVLIPFATKIRLIDLLSQCGFSRIEAASFVSPKWVPQMADAEQVMAGIHRSPAIAYGCLTPNLRGVRAALASGAHELAVFTSASEGFCQNNINCSIEQSLQRFEDVIDLARDVAIPVRGYVSCVTDCPYDGETSPEQVAVLAKRLLDMGCTEISLGDTLGKATPDRIEAMLKAVLTVAAADQLAGHFHDTAGHALENIKVSLEAGLRCFDSSVAGLGGCPYAPGAKGNVATEKVVALLHDLGFETQIDQERLSQASAFAKSLVN